MFNKEYNTIIELFKKYTTKSIIIDKFQIFETDNIQNIIQLYREFLSNNQKNNNNIIIDEELWFNYLEQFKKKIEKFLN